MPRNPNIPKISFTGRVIYSAISGTLNNKNKWRKYGAISALRSPQNLEVTDSLNSELDDTGRLVSARMDGDKVIPQIKYEYDPKISWNGTNDYTNLQTSTVVAQPQEAIFELDKIREAAPMKVKRSVWAVLEAEAEKWREQLLSLDPVDIGKAMKKIEALSSAQEVKRILNKTMESSFFSPIEVRIINALNTNAGKNPLYPAEAAGAPIAIQLMKSNDAIAVALENDMANLGALTQMEGRWIVIGGTASKLETYFRRVNQMGINSDGVKLDSMLNQNAVEYYSSSYIDATLGAGHFFVIAPGSAALPVAQEIRYLEGETVGNMTYSSLRMPAFDFDMDLRLLADSHITRKDAGGVDFVDIHPQIAIAPSLRYNVWTKPQGFHYADIADPLYAVNGIYHYVAQ